MSQYFPWAYLIRAVIVYLSSEFLSNCKSYCFSLLPSSYSFCGLPTVPPDGSHTSSHSSISSDITPLLPSTGSPTPTSFPFVSFMSSDELNQSLIRSCSIRSDFEVRVRNGWCRNCRLAIALCGDAWPAELSAHDIEVTENLGERYGQILFILSGDDGNL